MIGYCVYVEPTVDHIGGYGHIVGDCYYGTYLVEFTGGFIVEIWEEEIHVVC